MKLYLIGNSERVNIKLWAGRLRSCGFKALTTAEISEELEANELSQIAASMMGISDAVLTLPFFEKRPEANVERELAIRNNLKLFELRQAVRGDNKNSYILSCPSGVEYYCDTLTELASQLYGEIA